MPTLVDKKAIKKWLKSTFKKIIKTEYLLFTLSPQGQFLICGIP
jgi:hypothetical protein